MVSSLSSPVQTTASPIIQQQFTITYQYNVYFTEHLFAQDNSLLVDVIANQGGMDASNILVIVDEGLLAFHPTLIARIQDYCQIYSESINLVSAPIAVPAGEAAKNDAALVTQFQQAVSDLGICRHS